MCPNTADRRVTFSERRGERKGLIRKKIGDGAQSGEKGRPPGRANRNLGGDGWSYNHAGFPSSRMRSAPPPNSRSFQTSGLRLITTLFTEHHCGPQWLRWLLAAQVGAFHPGFQFWTVVYWGPPARPQTGGPPCDGQSLRGWSSHCHSSQKPGDWRKQTCTQIPARGTSVSQRFQG